MMADLLRRGRYADEVMALLAAESAERSRTMFRAVGRNDVCPCGSGQKFKRCHGAAHVHERDPFSRPQIPA